MIRMYSLDRTQFLVSSNSYESGVDNPIKFSDYQDSFSMLIGTKNNDIDWFNNPYIQAVVIEISTDWQLKVSEDIKLVPCGQEQLLKFMDESVSMYYQNSLCFEDLSKIKLWHTWFESNYKNIMISIAGCDPDTYQGQCKSDAEIDEFLKDNIFYLVF